MADEKKIGTNWQDDELDAIVADYFAMLSADLSGHPYVKSRHSAALMAQIGRTHRSVEFKHQNISAVLDELGMPWIPGYIPKRNYQNAIFGAIDRYLSRHREILEFVPKDKSASAVQATVFVEPPALRPSESAPTALRRLVRKFDPVERDHLNRSLGKARGWVRTPARSLFKLERTRDAKERAECCGYGRGRQGVLLSTKRALRVGAERQWLPGMDSNHELDRILKSQNLLILKSSRSRQKHQKQGFGTKLVQFFLSNRASGGLEVLFANTRARLLHGCGGAALCMQSGVGSRRSRPAYVARRA